jgi:hypothetical protein
MKTGRVAHLRDLMAAPDPSPSSRAWPTLTKGGSEFGLPGHFAA